MATPLRSTSMNKKVIYLLVAGATLLFVGANAHLLHAAVNSQPDCVAHVRVGHGQPGEFGAASSAC